MPGQLRANGKPRTSDYRQNRFRFWQHYRDLPLFSFAMIQWMLQDSTVRLGLGMREAAVCQAEFAYKDGQKWVPGVRASSEEVGQFVLSQVRLWWTHHVQKMAQAQVWGWSAAEVTYTTRDGLYEIHRTLHRHPEDVTPLLRGGELAGVRFKRVKSKGHVDVEFPYAYWHAFNPVAESNYGDPITRGCYCAWADKQLDGGAMDVLRLFMTKDAYGGMRIYYPEEEVFVQGDQRPNRDLAMEMVEQAKSGQVVTAPSARDANGQRLWEFEDARVSSNPQHILQYPKDLDVYILRGMEIADDVLTSEATGAWQGKQVPMQAFYSAMDRWLAQIVRTFDEQILRTLVTVNFGPEADYELETKPLAEQAMEMAGAGEQDPQSQGMQQQSPMQFSLDRGTVDAARLVQAARKVLDRGKRLQSDCGASGANPAPGFQYGNTCWKLTGKHKDALRKLTEQRDLRRQEEAEEERERVLQEKFDELGRDLEEMERQDLEGELKAEEEALKKAEDRKFRRSKMFRDIAETLETDDFEIVSDFRGLMEDLHKMLSDSAEAYNDVFDELVDQIVGKDIKGRQKRGAFVSGLKRAADPTRVPKFDEVVQYVRDNPEAQAVLATNLGESVGAGDLEAMVFEGLKRGKRPVPTLNSDETWNAALEYLGSVEPFEKTGEPIPFSIERLRRIVAYRFANAPKGGVTIAGKFFKGGQFIPKEVWEQASEEELAALESPKATKPTVKEAKAAAAEKKFEELMASKTPEDAAAFRAAKADGIAIPLAWTEVQYFGKDENIRAEGRDAKGRKQRAENPEYRQNVSNENNARINRDLMPRINELREQLRADAAKGDEEAKVLYLTSQSGFRIGGKGDGKAKVQAFGASTLQGEHVKVEGNTVTFDFPGKKGVRQQHIVEDKVIADMMRDAKEGQPVFATRDVKVRKAWQDRYGGAKVHDIRHVVATEIADEQLARIIPPPPKTERERNRIIKEVAKLAADKLGNNPSQALNTYIIPSIWGKVQVTA